MFKKLVVMIAAIETQEEFDVACGIVDNAYQRDKISWNDHEVLFNLLGKIEVK